MTAACLLITCPDRSGIVAAVASFLHAEGCNIVDADQHTDGAAGIFFQRIVFEHPELEARATSIEEAFGDIAGTYDMDWRCAWPGDRPRLAILVSGYDHCLVDLLLRQKSGELDCDIPLVISNHEDLKPIADQFSIPFHALPVSSTNREEQEEAIQALLVEHHITLVVLARYMQVLSPALVGEWSNRIINIHHSFLPAFAGGHPYQQALDRGVKQVGATAHYVTADLDDGPIIEQDTIRCSHRDTLEELIRKGRDIERSVLSTAVRLDLQDRILVYANKAVVFH